MPSSEGRRAGTDMGLGAVWDTRERKGKGGRRENVTSHRLPPGAATGVVGFAVFEVLRLASAPRHVACIWEDRECRVHVAAASADCDGLV
jgi:hypothetical protein